MKDLEDIKVLIDEWISMVTTQEDGIPKDTGDYQLMQGGSYCQDNRKAFEDFIHQKLDEETWMIMEVAFFMISKFQFINKL